LKSGAGIFPCPGFSIQPILNKKESRSGI